MQIISVIYRLAIAFWVGGVAIFTFVLTPIIFKAYDRDMAGQIVGALFPAYFRWVFAVASQGSSRFSCSGEGISSRPSSLSS